MTGHRSATGHRSCKQKRPDRGGASDLLVGVDEIRPRRRHQARHVAGSDEHTDEVVRELSLPGMWGSYLAGVGVDARSIAANSSSLSSSVRAREFCRT